MGLNLREKILPSTEVVPLTFAYVSFSFSSFSCFSFISVLFHFLGRDRGVKDMREKLGLSFSS